MNKYYGHFYLIIRLLLGVMWVWASLDKIQDPAQFSRDIANYHVMPFGLENLSAIVVPWLELLIGIGLIIGVMVDGAALISFSLMLLFIVLISQAILRGFNIECGCGLKEGQLVGWEKILENIVFLGASYLVLIRPKNLLELFPKTSLPD
tara:strand:+ start:5909 stop:6358 length:450 start_codon:yes stop_codon:yes gene_type:complete